MNLETLEDGITYCVEEAAEYRWKASLYDTDLEIDVNSSTSETTWKIMKAYNERFGEVND